MPERGMNGDKWLKQLVLALSLLAVSLGCQAVSDQLAEAIDAMAKGDYQTGVTLLGPLARGGSPDAQYLLGRAYTHGEGVEPDPVKAVKWLERAAYQLHYGAAKSLGKIYASGMGVKIDDNLAAKWFARAAEIAEVTGGEHVDCDE